MGLLYSKPRAATVVAQTDGELLFLDRRALKAALSSMDLRETLAALRRVEALKPLMSCELQLVLDLMARRTFGAGEAICRQGDEGDAFYIILEGDVDCLVQEGAAEPRKVLSLSRHQHFGERSLAGPGKRAATVVARGPVVALEISRQVFEDAVGTLQAAVESSEQWRQGTASRTAVPRFQPRRDLSGLTVTPTSKVEQLWGSDRASVARVEYKGEGTSGAEGEAGSVLARITPLPSGVADHAARGVGVMSVVPDSAVVPAPARVVRDSRGLTELLDTEPLCTLAAVLAQGPLTEASAKVRRGDCSAPRPARRSPPCPARPSRTGVLVEGSLPGQDSRPPAADLHLACDRPPSDSARSTWPPAWPSASRTCIGAGWSTGQWLPRRWCSRSPACSS